VFATVSLSILSIAVAMFAGATIAATNLHYTLHEFANTMFTFTRFGDLVTCVIKAVVFGTIVPMVAMHHGLRCSAGSEGVGNAATNAVVQSSLLIIIADFVLTYLLYAL
jgi:phospholipid/cholesterol/gamma-HCH transport system permease protein